MKYSVYSINIYHSYIGTSSEFEKKKEEENNKKLVDLIGDGYEIYSKSSVSNSRCSSTFFILRKKL